MTLPIVDRVEVETVFLIGFVERDHHLTFSIVGGVVSGEVKKP